MKRFLLLGLLATFAFATPAAAQTVPHLPYVQPNPPQLPTGPLSSSEVGRYLLLLGFDPLETANLLLRSEFAYGFYFTIDQALAVANGEGEIF